MSDTSDPIVGIDLGTSNAVVAYAEPTGAVRILADESGYKIHPSVVSFHPNGGVVVGASAKQRKVIDPRNTVFSVKRMIGRPYDSREVQTAKQRMPFEIKEGAKHAPTIVTRAGEFAVPEISAIVLDHIRNVASTALGSQVGRAVVTVPAAFNDAQRSATATAGSIAGLTVVRVLNEPTAAALAYGHMRQLQSIIAVYDFGGGTFDITVLKLSDQVYEVLGTAGDTFLGGDDLDERLVDRMVEKFLAENRVDLRTNEVSMMRLRAVAEQTKIELSRRNRAVVRVDEIAYGPNGKALDLQIEITRDDFVRQIADIVDRTFPVCNEALKYAGLDPSGIDDVVLVGGSTKIPYVRDQVSKFFAKSPRTDVSPEDAVALGAGLQATALERILKRKPTSRAVSASESFEDPITKTSPVIEEDTFTDDSVGFSSVTATETIETTPTAVQAAPSRRGDRPAEPGHQVDRLGDEKRTTLPIGKLSRAPTAATQPAAPPIAPQLPPSSARTMPGIAPKPVAPTPPPPPLGPPPPLAPPPPLPVLFDTEPATRPGAQPLASTMMTVPEPAAPPSVTARGFAAPVAPAEPRPFGAPIVPVVIDVTPRGLGIGTVAGFCEELIRRNSRLPAEIRKVFMTSRDDQDTVRIVVVQGESRRMSSNVVIGDLTLSDLPRRPRGETAIEVTFTLDASGILKVRALDAKTGREQRASLDVIGGMQQDDLEASRDRLTTLRR